MDLFTPGAIGNITIPNRIVMAPVNTNYGDEEGHVGDKTLGFYRKRAAGGAGALILEAMQVDPTSKIVSRQMGIFDDGFLPGLARLTDEIHEHGAKAFVQINHGGPKAPRELNGRQCVSASRVAVKRGNLPRALSISEIAAVVKLHADAARRAAEAGFDGVEVQACHFYLLSAFLSGYLNRRTDEYGGSTRNRVRIVSEVIAAIKEACGPDYPVVVRINGVEDLPGGIDQSEGIEIAKLLEAAGADAIDVSAAIHPVNPDLLDMYEVTVGGGPPETAPEGCYLPIAGAIRNEVSVPVIAVGKIFSPETALGALTHGDADFVALARALIADHQLPDKIRNGQWDAIVKCTECRACHTSMQRKKELVCSVNRDLW